MKKLFLMIATVALVASCTGNGNTSGSASGEKKDSTKTEETKEKKDTLKGPATIDNPTWSVELPDGWQAPSVRPGDSQKSSSYCELKPIVVPDGFKGPVGVRISSYPYKSNTVEKDMESFFNIYKDAKKDGEVEIGGVKFQKAVKVYPDGNTVTRLSAPLKPEGNVSINLSHMKYDEEIIQTILKSFKFKPAEAEAK
ncbi:MAG: hypothetical protein IJR20_04765 [Muribaculaceae bacterium]|nr:hypothetical protein [Muribaculaceae bacterium]